MSIQKSDKIYVAGHTGLVGSALVRTLRAHGYENLLLKTRQEMNLLDHAAVSSFFASEKPDVVLIAAGKLGGVYANNTYRAEFIYENVTMESHLIHQSFLNEVRKLIHFGCSSVYPRECPQPMKEEYLLTGPLEPTNEPFAIAKLTGIKMCESYHRQYGVDFLSLIPTNLYGENQDYTPLNSLAIPALIRKFHEAKEQNESRVSIWGSGEQVRDFLHADDLAEATMCLLTNYTGRGPINIGSGIEYSIRDTAEKIADIVGFQGKISCDSTKPEGVLRRWPDTSAIRALGWSPKIHFEEGLRRTYIDFLQQLGRQ